MLRKYYEETAPVEFKLDQAKRQNQLRLFLMFPIFRVFRFTVSHSRRSITKPISSALDVKAAFHDTDTDILARILARKLRVSDVRMYSRVGRVGVGAVECGV